MSGSTDESVKDTAAASEAELESAAGGAAVNYETFRNMLLGKPIDEDNY